MAANPHSRRHLHLLVDQLDEQQVMQAEDALETIRHSSVISSLRELAGLRMPDHWPPRYRSVEPLSVPGDPASEQITRERR